MDIEELCEYDPDLIEEGKIESHMRKLAIPGKIRKANKRLGFKMPKSAGGLSGFIKIHGKNPGFDEVIKNTDKIDELEYMITDTSTIFYTLEVTKKRLKLCKELGDCKQTKTYYKAIKKWYIDEGITEKDIDLTVAETKKRVALMRQRKKQLQKEQK